jgi:hypothetical protein
VWQNLPGALDMRIGIIGGGVTRLSYVCRQLLHEAI